MTNQNNDVSSECRDRARLTGLHRVWELWRRVAREDRVRALGADDSPCRVRVPVRGSRLKREGEFVGRNRHTEQRGRAALNVGRVASHPSSPGTIAFSRTETLFG